jgi:hypothetical protein
LYPSAAPTENTQQYNEHFFALLPVHTEVMSVQQCARTIMRKENTPEEQSINWKAGVDGSDEKILSLVGKDLLFLNELCGLFFFI